MTADEAIAYADDILATNAQVNGSSFSNPAIAKAAEVASKLKDVASQLKAHEDRVVWHEPPQRTEPEAEPKAKRKRGGTDHFEG